MDDCRLECCGRWIIFEKIGKLFKRITDQRDEYSCSQSAGGSHLLHWLDRLQKALQ